MRNLHLVNRADAIGFRRPAPPDASAGAISLRCYLVEVAGPACHGRMQVMGHLFVVWLMALTAFARLLVAMFECCSLGMADQALHIRMRGCGIVFLLNQGKRIRLPIFRAVAVQAELYSLLLGPGFIAGGAQVALQARLILVRKIRQFVLYIVTLAAFFSGRPVKVHRCRFNGSRCLVMRVVALDTDVKTLVDSHFLTCMTAFGDFLENRFMTARALLGLKKIRQTAIDINRIRVAAFFYDMAVTVLAGELTMHRDVKAFMVDQPTGFSAASQVQQGCHCNCGKYEIFPKRHD